MHFCAEQVAWCQCRGSIGPEDIVLEDIVPKDSVPEDIVPEDIVPKDKSGSHLGRTPSVMSIPLDRTVRWRANRLNCFAVPIITHFRFCLMSNPNPDHPLVYRPGEAEGRRRSGENRVLFWMAGVLVVILFGCGGLIGIAGYMAVRPTVKDTKISDTREADHRDDLQAFRRSIDGFAEWNARPLGQSVETTRPFVMIAGQPVRGDDGETFATDHPDVESAAGDLHQWVLQTSEAYLDGQSPGPVDMEGFLDAMSRSPYGPLRNLQRMLVSSNIDATFLIPDVEAFTRVVGIEFPRGDDGSVHTDVARVDLITGSPNEFPFSVQWFVRRGDDDWLIYDWQRLEYGRRQSDEMVDYLVCSDTICRYDQALEMMGKAVTQMEVGDRKKARREAEKAHAIQVRPVNRVAHQLRSAWTMEYLEMHDESDAALRALFNQRHFGCETSLTLTALRNDDRQLARAILDRVTTTDPYHPNTASIVQMVAPTLIEDSDTSDANRRELRRKLIESERTRALFDLEYETLWSTLFSQIGEDIDLMEPVFADLSLDEPSAAIWIAILESGRWDPDVAKTIQEFFAERPSTPAIIRDLATVVRHWAEDDSDAALETLLPLYKSPSKVQPFAVATWIEDAFHEIHYEEETFETWFATAREPEDCVDFCLKNWWNDDFYIEDLEGFLNELNQSDSEKANLLRGLVLYDADREDEAIQTLEGFLSDASDQKLAENFIVDDECVIWSEPIVESVQQTIASILVEQNRYREAIERFAHIDYSMQRLAQRLIYQASEQKIRKLLPIIERRLEPADSIQRGLNAVIYGPLGETSYPSYRRWAVRFGDEVAWPDSIVRDAALRQWVARMVAKHEPEGPYANALFRNDEVGDSLIPWVIEQSILCGNTAWYESAIRQVPLQLSRMPTEKQGPFVTQLLGVLSERGTERDLQRIHELLDACIAEEEIEFFPWVLESTIATHLVGGDTQSARKLLRWFADAGETGSEFKRLTRWIESGARIGDAMWDEWPKKTAAEWAFSPVVAACTDPQSLIELRRHHGVARNYSKLVPQQTVEMFSAEPWEIDAVWIRGLLQAAGIAFVLVEPVDSQSTEAMQTWAVVFEKGPPMVVSTIEYETPQTVACPAEWFALFQSDRWALRFSATAVPDRFGPSMSDLAIKALGQASTAAKVQWLRENDSDVYRLDQYVSRYRDQQPIEVVNWFEPPDLFAVDSGSEPHETDPFSLSVSVGPDVDELRQRLSTQDEPIEVLVSMTIGTLEERLGGHVVEAGKSIDANSPNSVVVELIEDSRYDRCLRRGMRVHTHSYAVREIR